jgi:lipoprotein-releasing system ATP-binding protein
MAETQTLLELTDVTKAYEATADAPVTSVLKGVNLYIGAGETVAIVGPSGSGKSTLLNIIGTLDRPTGGKVVLNGRDLTTLDDRALAAARTRDIGLIFQFHHLLPQCTVLENVLLPTLAGSQEARAEAPQQRARRLLQRVGLSERLNHRPGQLSGGERQRAAVVRALINEPRLLLADEPTGSLDRASADNLANLLVELNREEGVALLVITHALSLAERMERVYTLQDGMLTLTAAPI